MVKTLGCGLNSWPGQSFYTMHATDSTTSHMGQGTFCDSYINIPCPYCLPVCTAHAQ